MNAVNNKLVLQKSDYELLIKYVHTHLHPLSKEQKNAEQLFNELRIADVHERKEDIPSTIVQLYSMVEVEEQGSQRSLRFKIVLPAEADMRKQKLSVFAPLSIAIMGYSEGQRINWEMPSGKKEFLIRKVKNLRSPDSSG
jgi:regulator of nucleoside diphosphate kinase